MEAVGLGGAVGVAGGVGVADAVGVADGMGVADAVGVVRAVVVVRTVLVVRTVVVADRGSGTLHAACAASRALFACCSALRAARNWARVRAIAASSAVWMALTWRWVAVRTTFDWLRVAFALGTAGLATMRSSAACCAARLAFCCLRTCRAAYVSILASTSPVVTRSPTLTLSEVSRPPLGNPRS